METTIIYDEDVDYRVIEALFNLVKMGYPLSSTEFAEHKGCLFIRTPHKRYLALHNEMIDVGNDGWTVAVEII